MKEESALPSVSLLLEQATRTRRKLYSKDRAVCHDFSSLVRKSADLFVFYILVNSRISLREGGRQSRKRGRKKEERERERWRKKEREVKEERVGWRKL